MTRPYVGYFEETFVSLRIHVDIENPRICCGRNRRYLEENGDIQKYPNSVTDKCRVGRTIIVYGHIFQRCTLLACRMSSILHYFI